MSTKFNEKALTQLHKYNCPVSIDASDNILIDVAVKRALNMPFLCVQTKTQFRTVCEFETSHTYTRRG